MTNDSYAHGSSAPSSPADVHVKRFPYDSVGDGLAGTIEVRTDGNGGLVVRILKPILLSLVPRRFGWTVRLLVTFIGGVAGSIFYQWLQVQPGFIRLMDWLPASWP